MKHLRRLTVRAAAIAVLGFTLCGCAQDMLLPRPQPEGPDENHAVFLSAAKGYVHGSTGPWDPAKTARFETVLAMAESLKPGSPELSALRARFQRAMAQWRSRANRRGPGQRKPLPETFVNSVGITMKLIQPGTFQMGSEAPVADSDERPVHSVEVTRPFYIGVYEVTNEQWARVMGGDTGDAPRRVTGTREGDARGRLFAAPEGDAARGRLTGRSGHAAPCERVSWTDAVEFCRRLSQKEGVTYVLPTEAQWEYACRAGTRTRFSFGDRWNELASRQPNQWGLYDMHGNAGEWCADWYAESYAGAGGRDPTGPAAGEYRVTRGGAWNDEWFHLRSASRGRQHPADDYGRGIRIVVVPGAGAESR